MIWMLLYFTIAMLGVVITLAMPSNNNYTYLDTQVTIALGLIWPLTLAIMIVLFLHENGKKMVAVVRNRSISQKQKDLLAQEILDWMRLQVEVNYLVQGNLSPLLKCTDEELADNAKALAEYL